MKYAMTAGVLALAVCGGCTLAADGTEPSELEGEEVSVFEEAIGEASCKTASPDAIAWDSPNLTTPATYDNPNCDKAYVVHIKNWTAKPGKYLLLQHVDSMPQNPLACESLVVRMDTYKYQIGGGGWQFDATRTTSGEWYNGSCGIGIASRLIPSSGEWKVAIQGIRNVLTTPTRKVRLWTLE